MFLSLTGSYFTDIMIYSSDVAETKGEAVLNNTSDHMPPPLLLRENCGENYAGFGNHRKRAQINVMDLNRRKREGTKREG